MKYGITLLSLFATILPALADPNPAVETALGRIWTEYQSRLAEAIKAPKATYLRDLENLERDAMRNHDAFAAAAIRKERESADLVDTPLDIPDKKHSTNMDELRRLRARFEREKDEAIPGALNGCRKELEAVESAFMKDNDPISAARIRVEREALSRPHLRLIRASYGSKDKRVDISLRLRTAMRFNRLEAPTGHGLDGNPHHGRVKNTSVTFRVGSGTEKTIVVGDGDDIKIP